LNPFGVEEDEEKNASSNVPMEQSVFGGAESARLLVVDKKKRQSINGKGPLTFMDRKGVKSFDEPSAPTSFSERKEIKSFDAGLNNDSFSFSRLRLARLELSPALKISNIELGIEENAFRDLLSECLNDVDRARQLTKEKVIAAYDQGLVSSLDLLWRPPLLVRVSSWLPDIEDPGSRELHTGYYMSISLTSFPAHRWQIVARYAKYYELYCRIHKSLESVFPNGMTHPFPDDRLKSR
jgi:hypothetical protein